MLGAPFFQNANWLLDVTLNMSKWLQTSALLVNDSYSISSILLGGSWSTWLFISSTSIIGQGEEGKTKFWGGSCINRSSFSRKCGRGRERRRWKLFAEIKAVDHSFTYKYLRSADNVLDAEDVMLNKADAILFSWISSRGPHHKGNLGVLCWTGVVLINMQDTSLIYSWPFPLNWFYRDAPPHLFFGR